MPVFGATGPGPTPPPPPPVPPNQSGNTTLPATAFFTPQLHTPIGPPPAPPPVVPPGGGTTILPNGPGMTVSGQSPTHGTPGTGILTPPPPPPAPTGITGGPTLVSPIDDCMRCVTV